MTQCDNPANVNDGLSWYIRIIGGTLNGAVYSIGTGLGIGRNSECNVHYPTDTKGVSRKHCRIYPNGNSICVMDFGSSLGTYVGNIGKLMPNVPQMVHSGDIVYLGGNKNVIVIKFNH